ncbi:MULTISPECIES: hypothetical protein [unclassified Mesorhizobium]|uniref:hypothetical protein n=1 Tax=unclassified Mesorhizobium TaxID=325217 RepID=UPI0012EC7265|nr:MULTISPECIES: hypothetical protein [unclassified Mesorhizobium]WJI76109.1 hypothetical protein NLY37_05185 [Mesorhizobium sp. C395A]
MKHWSEWLKRVPAIRRKFCRWSSDFDPFYWNEAASVAVLANAASQAGYLAHTEYVALKRDSTRGRPFRQGRCDLWVADVQDGISWAFEVKQHFAASKIRQATFDSRLERARRDASHVDREEADQRVGCLIMVPGEHTSESEELVTHFDSLCKNADVAFRLNGGLRSIWLAFALVT